MMINASLHRDGQVEGSQLDKHKATSPLNKKATGLDVLTTVNHSQLKGHMPLPISIFVYCL